MVEYLRGWQFSLSLQHGPVGCSLSLHVYNLGFSVTTLVIFHFGLSPIIFKFFLTPPGSYHLSKPNTAFDTRGKAEDNRIPHA